MGQLIALAMILIAMSFWRKTDGSSVMLQPQRRHEGADFCSSAISSPATLFA